MIDRDSDLVVAAVEDSPAKIERREWLLPAAVFCALTFFLSWMLWLSAMLVDQRATVKLKISLFHLDMSFRIILTFAGVVVPGIVALLLGLFTGWRFFPNPLRRIRSRARAGSLWFLAVASPTVIVFTAFLLAPDLSPNSFSDLRFIDLARLLLINFFLGPFWEECGWRGCLLPMLACRFGLGRASLIVGLIWGAWHLPIYLGIFHASLTSYFFVFISVVGISFIQSTLYANSGNSLLLPIMFHNVWNEMTAWMAPGGFTHIQSAFSAIALWIFAGLLWLWKRPTYDAFR
jgi:membrane protease YdiL (CAAX protease family)